MGNKSLVSPIQYPALVRDLGEAVIRLRSHNWPGLAGFAVDDKGTPHVVPVRKRFGSVEIPSPMLRDAVSGHTV